MTKILKSRLSGFFLALIFLPLVPHTLCSMEGSSYSIPDSTEVTDLFERIVREGLPLLNELLNANYDFRFSLDTEGNPLPIYLARRGHSALLVAFMKAYKTCCFWIDNHKNTTFHVAVQNPDLLKVILNEMKKRHGINNLNAAGRTPLCEAIAQHQLRSVELLIDSGALLVVRKANALESAVRVAATATPEAQPAANSIVELLLRYSSVEERNNSRRYLFAVARENAFNNPSLLVFLNRYIEQPPIHTHLPIFTLAPRPPTFILPAPEVGQPARKRQKLAKSDSTRKIFYCGLPSWRETAKIREEDEELLEKAFQNDENALQKLLGTKLATYHYLDANGQSLTHYLVKKGNVKAFQKLLEKEGENCLMPDADGNTAVHLAAQQGLQQIIDTIALNYPHHLDQFNYRAQTPRSILATRSIATNFNNLPLLFSSTSEQQGQDEADDSFLKFLAADNELTQQTNTVDLTQAIPSPLAPADDSQDSPQLLSVSPDYSGLPLHYAVLHQNIDDVRRALSDSRIDPNGQDVLGRTPLHVAAVVGDTDIARVILEDPRTDIRITDRAGQTPFVYALERSHHCLMQLLIPRMLDLQTRCNVFGL